MAKSSSLRSPSASTWFKYSAASSGSSRNIETVASSWETNGAILDLGLVVVAIALLKLLPVRLCADDVALLRALRAGDQENDDRLLHAAVVHAVAGADIDPQLRHPVADPFVIPQVTELDADDALGDRGLCHLVLEELDPRLVQVFASVGDVVNDG